MASVYKSGKTAVLQIGKGKARRVKRLGTLSTDGVRKVQFHVDQIEQAKRAAAIIPPDTVAWLSEIADDLHEKLAALELVEPRKSAEDLMPMTLGKLFDDFLARRVDLKKTTRTNYEQAKKKATAYFGPLFQASKVGVPQAKDYRRHLEATLSAASVSGFIKRMRCLFTDAVERGILKENPFKGVVAGGQTNEERLRFVSQTEIEQVIAGENCVQWRCLIALARYGGLRTPSEPYQIKLSDVDWSENEIVIRSAKTKRQGKALRRVPIFDELLPYLRAAYDSAAADQLYLLSRVRIGVNPHTRLKRLVIRVSLQSWPRLFQNLRASRESELISRGYSVKTVCNWIGNSEAVARAHYLMMMPGEKERAVTAARAAKSAAISSRENAQFAQVKEKDRDFQAETAVLSSGAMLPVTPTGIEPVSRP